MPVLVDIPPRHGSHMPMGIMLQRYIRESYKEDPAKYQAECDALDAARHEFMTNERLSPTAMFKFFSQISHLNQKFPINDRNIKISFTWQHAFQPKKKVTSFSINFEKSSIMFNIAARFSQLAMAEDIKTSEGIKAACRHFQNAAGVFSHLHSLVIHWFPEPLLTDASPNTLKCLENLMLAQAQECFYLKAVADNKADRIVSKLAASAADLYDQSYDSAVTDRQRLGVEQDFLVLIQTKACMFHAIKEFKAAPAHLKEEKYGEEICRLRAAFTLCNKGIQLGSKNAVLLQELQELREIIKARAVSAEKDNDNIYMALIPDHRSLPPVARGALMVKTPALMDFAPVPDPGWIFFSNLMSLAVQKSLAQYSEKKTAYVQQLINGLEENIAVLTKSLTDLGLPASVEAAEQPKGLPAGLAKRCEEVHADGGASGLVSSYDNLMQIASKQQADLREAMAILDAEERHDQEMRQQYGNRWTCASSRTLTEMLRKEGARYADMQATAAKSDDIIRAKLEMHRAGIEALSGTVGDLELSIPASTAANTSWKSEELAMLRSLLDQVPGYKDSCHELTEELLRMATNDVISSTLLDLQDEGKDLASCFDSELEKYQPLKLKVEEQKLRRDELIQRITDANAKFIASKGSNPMMAERETALKVLDISYNAFVELKKNLQDAGKFYTSMEASLAKFSASCKDYEFARKTEMHELLAQLQSITTGVNVSPVPIAQRVDPLQPRFDPNTGLPLPTAPSSPYIPYPFAAPAPAPAPNNGQYPRNYGPSYF